MAESSSSFLRPSLAMILFGSLWGVEPLTYIGVVLVLIGLGVISVSVVMPALMSLRAGGTTAQDTIEQRWGRVTQRYFELFDHDLSRPLRRILGKERELRAVLRSTGTVDEPEVKELLDEIERQAPNFRLMMSNVRVLVQLESPQAAMRNDTVEPTEVIRKIVDRYMPVAAESSKDLTWWSEPSEFGIVYSNSSAIEHIVVNLVDNAVRYAASQVEIKLSKNPSHFFIRVWDDGPGISVAYLPHVFDHGWTPEVARREEKTSSGVGPVYRPHPGQKFRRRHQCRKCCCTRCRSSHSVSCGFTLRNSLNQSQGGMCICRVLGIGAGVSRECFGP